MTMETTGTMGMGRRRSTMDGDMWRSTKDTPTPVSPQVVILCADEGSRETLAYWLGASGISNGVALTGYDASSLLGPGGAHLLITDRVLPPWPGLDSLTALKLAHPTLKVAFIDDGLPDTRALVRSAGVDIILARPLRRASVTAALSGADPAEGVACAT